MKKIKIVGTHFLYRIKAFAWVVALGVTCAGSSISYAQETLTTPQNSEVIEEQATPNESPAKSTEKKPPRAEPLFSSGHLAQTVLGLGAVIFIMFGLLWMMKRAGLSPGHRANGFYRVLHVSSLGPKEKIALIEVGDTWLMIGMTQHSINTLFTMPKDSLDLTKPGTKATEAFSRMLDKMKTPQVKA